MELITTVLMLMINLVGGAVTWKAPEPERPAVGGSSLSFGVTNGLPVMLPRREGYQEYRS